MNPPDQLLGQLRDNERGLVRAVKRALPSDAEAELVLVIDQFEELFTLVEGEITRLHPLDCNQLVDHQLRDDVLDRMLGEHQAVCIDQDDPVVSVFQ